MITEKLVEHRFAEIERQIADMRAAQTPFSSDSQDVWLRRGNLILQDDGAFQIKAADGQKLAEFDKDSVRFFDTSENVLATLSRQGVEIGDAPVVLDADGLDIANGLVIVDALGLAVGPASLDASGVDVGPTTLDSNGLTVGTDVEIDSTGLKIDGVLQPAIETIRHSGSFQNVSLGTSFTNLVSLNLSIPSFATVVDVLAIGRLQIANTSGGVQSFEARASVAGGATDTARDYADNNLTSNVTATRADRVTGSPSTVNVLLEGRVTSGSNSSNVGRLNVLAIARRVA